MKIKVDRGSVFVCADDFIDSEAVFGSCHDFCVAAAVAMEISGATKSVNFVDSEDRDLTWPFAFKEGRILKVTVEWVDASEADPEKYKGE